TQGVTSVPPAIATPPSTLTPPSTNAADAEAPAQTVNAQAVNPQPVDPQVAQLFQEAFDFDAFSTFADASLSQIVPATEEEEAETGENLGIQELGATAGFVLPLVQAETVQGAEELPETASDLSHEDLEALLSLMDDDEDWGVDEADRSAPAQSSSTAIATPTANEPSTPAALPAPATSFLLTAQAINDLGVEEEEDPWDSPAGDLPRDRPLLAGAGPVASDLPESHESMGQPIDGPDLSNANLEQANLSQPIAVILVDPASQALTVSPAPSPNAQADSSTAIAPDATVLALSHNGVARGLTTEDPTETPTESTAMGSPAVGSTAPSGYLASSEALLESLPEDEDATTLPAWLEGLLSPLGLGSILLLLLSSSTLGYVAMNPSMMEQWGVDRLLTLIRPSSSPDATTAPPLDPDATPAQPPGPDLAAQEFVDLGLDNLSSATPQTPITTTPGAPMAPGTPGTVTNPTGANESLLSGLKTAIDPTGTLAARTATTPSSPTAASPSRPGGTSGGTTASAPSRIAAPPAPVLDRPAPVSRPAPIAPPVSLSTTVPLPPAPVAAPAPPPKPIEPAPPPAPVVRSSGSFSVVTPYTSDRLLDQAQQVVPDAYLKNSDQGANIQFGVFDDRASAESLLQELESQGIPAQIQE
ncbi:MAG: hypothetical protein ACO35Q_01890, partial [Prochlorothrix sp.]